MEDVNPNPAPPSGSRPLDPLGVAVAATLAVFLAFLLVSPVQVLNLALGVWFTQLFVFLGGGWLVLSATGRAPARYTGLSAWSAGPAAFGFVLGVANFFGIIAPVQYLAQLVLPGSWNDYDVSGIFLGQSPVELAFIVAGLGIGAPLCEEFFFRGVFFRGLLARGGPPWRALFFSAALFSAFHLDRMGFVSRLELGLVFGWLLWRTGSLWPGILAHAANNLVSTALFFGARHLESARTPSPGDEGRMVVLLALGGCAVLLGLLSAARRFPGLLGGPLRPLEEREAPEPPVHLEPPTRLLRRAFPWMTAATLVLGAYVVLDPVGIELSQVDLRYPLAPVPEDAPDALHAERNALYELRVRARRGETPVGEYTQERRRQSRQSGGGRPPVLPTPNLPASKETP
ncbi:CAAX amino terminal protease family protein [Cystobacter fuscus]|uniref:CAAX amino terminal protease family protein n=1 Tax=Cystobacter fuscus TaxID=43 RepID=A0A250J6D8_9BACT|nr:type II CAAX endopeptidase family protein [Cystobacter fuscus]ATB38736.1 CAAX amino terminal protease family protein [Cystobacter fuscus]